ncbi:MAG TPA: heavy-metal-associated domain-containing protein [Glaciihabitans sp.]|jgi:copper chaperone CopZ|nr:heavy-metal-associated domain-containing protein [Glaciihabitans sp.]
MCSSTSGSNDLGLTDKNHACACATESHSDHVDHSAASTVLSSDMIREHFVVQGMTCNHCVSSVTKEVSAIDGVESVSVDLNAGGPSNIIVVSTKPITVDEVRSAVTEAGYELVTA